MVTTRLRKQKNACLVTGGSGFLGQHLVRQLLDSGEWSVTVFDVRSGADPRARLVIGDLRDQQQVINACKGMDIVFHCAAAAPSASNAVGNEKLMRDVNVFGTEHVIAACRALGVTGLVYTSSASVVFEGRDLLNVDESIPLAKKPMDFYTSTKIKGEQLVLEANGADGLATVALRPSGIFGEGDPLFVPVVVEKAKIGKLKYIIGSGSNLMDFTYVGNVAHAHILAAKALLAELTVAGQAYFITNDDARPFWTFLGEILAGLRYEPRLRPHIKLPYLLVFMLAAIFEYLVMPLCKAIGNPLTASEFTVNRIAISASNRRFDITRAKTQLGYTPLVSVDEGIARTVKSFGHLRAETNGKHT